MNTHKENSFIGLERFTGINMNKNRCDCGGTGQCAYWCTGPAARYNRGSKNSMSKEYEYPKILIEFTLRGSFMKGRCVRIIQKLESVDEVVIEEKFTDVMGNPRWEVVNSNYCYSKILQCAFIKMCRERDG